MQAQDILCLNFQADQYIGPSIFIVNLDSLEIIVRKLFLRHYSAK